MSNAGSCMQCHGSEMFPFTGIQNVLCIGKCLHVNNVDRHSDSSNDLIQQTPPLCLEWTMLQRLSNDLP